MGTVLWVWKTNEAVLNEPIRGAGALVFGGRAVAVHVTWDEPL